MQDGDFRVRVTGLDEKDVEAIVHHRRAMFFDMGYRDEKALELMCERFRPWLRGRMEAGEYLAWFAIAPDETVVAGAGLWLMDWPPHMVGGGEWRGNILNVYTEAAYRRRGLARRLMQMAMDWCEKIGVETVILHASPEGRGLYQRMGFEATNEMRWKKPGERARGPRAENRGRSQS
jgi:ribosomal protein S18 acetylase RimI-like enzyme